MPQSSDKPTILAFDVGNTSVKCAVLVRGRWQRLARVATRPVEHLGHRLAEGFPEGKARSMRPQRCVVSSVCPAADDAVASFSRGLGVGKVEFFGRDLPVPINTKVREPEKVGTDRLLAALAARELRGAPCIIVSAGTAITVDLIDAAGCFAGGAIAPGFHLSARALHEQTALLPLVEPARPVEPAGRDTAEAVQSGVYWSCAGGVLALVERFKELPGCADAPVLCTGSDASLLLPVLAGGPPQADSEPDLIFRGTAVALGLPA
jgi:type III pantothenate kinase